MPRTVIIADDHPFTVEGMRAMLAGVPDIDVVATAHNGIDAIAKIKKHAPDCAILDLSMPGANGLSVFTEAKHWSPGTKFVIVTGISAQALFKQLYDAGIDGLFVKNTPPEQICEGIVRVMDGERVIAKPAMAAIEAAQENDDLSKREMQVLRGLAQGQTNREIAQALGVSPKTVDSHRTNLLKKLNVHSTASLLVKALRSGLLDMRAP